MTRPTNEELERFTKKAIDNGLIIQAGWLGYCIAVMPDKVQKVQYDEMRGAFFAGAQHLFSSIMSAMEPGANPTANDMNRMTMIASELDAFVQQFKKDHGL